MRRRRDAASGVDVHMIGFAKVVGDIADGAMSVIVFAIDHASCSRCWPSGTTCSRCKVALVPIVCSIVAVIWQLGTLVLLGYGIDPLGLLVPFLIFAIGVSHGVQKISAVKEAAVAGVGSMDAARQTFRQLLMPAIIALLADLVGFITILLIPVQVVQEMAVTASIGVAIVILTDLILLPVLVSWVQVGRRNTARASSSARRSSRRTGTGSRASPNASPRSIIIGIARAARRLRRVEGPRDADRRHAGRRAGAARRFALQPRQQHHHVASSRSASTSSR